MSRDTLPIPVQSPATTRAALWPAALLVLAGSLAWFLVGTAGIPLIDRDEPMIAEVARQMVHRGEYLAPHLPAWEERSIFKPPGAMWLMAASFKILGVTEFAARLPSVLCSALTVTILFVAAARRWGRAAGIVAAVAMAVPLLPALVGRMVLTEPLLVLLATIVLLCLERSLRGGAPLWVKAAMWIALGLTLPVKGPAMLVFFGPAIVLAVDGFRWRPYLIFAGGMAVGTAGSWLALKGYAIVGLVVGGLGGLVVMGSALWWLVRVVRLPIGAAWGIPLMLLAGGWWFVYIHSAGGSVLQASAKRYLMWEVLTRIAQPAENHYGPPGYYLLVAALALLPFAGLLPTLFAWSFRNRSSDATVQLLLGWTVGSWLLWEIVVTKLPHYVCPALPAVALLAGLWWSRGHEPVFAFARRWSSGQTLAKVAALWMLMLTVLLLLAAGRLDTLSRKAAEQALTLGGPDTSYYGFKTEPGVFFHLPPDRYDRIRRREEIGQVRRPGPFVLILAPKYEKEARGAYPNRVIEAGRVEGLNLAKGSWEQLSVLRIGPAAGGR